MNTVFEDAKEDIDNKIRYGEVSSPTKASEKFIFDLLDKAGLPIKQGDVIKPEWEELVKKDSVENKADKGYTEDVSEEKADFYAAPNGKVLPENIKIGLAQT